MKFLRSSSNNDQIDASIHLIDKTNPNFPKGLSDQAKTYFQKLIDQKRSGLFALSDTENDSYLFISSNLKSDFESNEKLRQDCVKISDSATEMKYMTIEIVADDTIALDGLLVVAEAVALANYSFNKYRSSEKTRVHEVSKIILKHAELKDDLLKRTENRIFYVNNAKNLVNTPNLHLGVKELGESLQKEAEKLGLDFTSFTRKEIEDRKMGGLLGVNAGSPDDPGFFVIEYKPEKAINEKPLVLVGKGVVYDTGGYSLKPSTSMLTMKADMAGSAAASNALFAIAANEYPIHAYAIIPATDNRVEKKAIVPDDVITISDGTTVEVQNTDAEGRLILADALVYAKSLNPELVIDFATLTGAAAYLTGHFSSAFFSNANSDFTQKMISAGEVTYERLLQLPLWDEYKDMLKSSIADIRNIGGRVGGMITAAKFLEHFTDYPWMHIDIAGPAYLDSKEAYRSNGATGVGVRLIEEFVYQWVDSKS